MPCVNLRCGHSSCDIIRVEDERAFSVRQTEKVGWVPLDLDLPPNTWLSLQQMAQAKGVSINEMLDEMVEKYWGEIDTTQPSISFYVDFKDNTHFNLSTLLYPEAMDHLQEIMRLNPQVGRGEIFRRTSTLKDIYSYFRKKKSTEILEPVKKGMAQVREETPFDYEDSIATCVACNREMTIVRPGKYQCDTEGCRQND